MKTILRLPLILFLLMLPCISCAEDIPWENAWQKGLGALEYGDYETAVASFESVIQAGHESASVYHNLSLAYLGEGQSGLAELARERALMLKPDLYGETFWEKIHFSSESMAWCAAFFLWLLAALFLVSFFSGKRNWLRIISITVCSILFLCSLWGLWNKRADFSKAVVVVPGKRLKHSPTEHSSDVTVVSEGEPVQIMQHQGNWLKIRTTNDATGWISANDCIPVWRVE